MVRVGGWFWGKLAIQNQLVQCLQVQNKKYLGDRNKDWIKLGMRGGKGGFFDFKFYERKDSGGQIRRLDYQVGFCAGPGCPNDLVILITGKVLYTVRTNHLCNW